MAEFQVTVRRYYQGQAADDKVYVVRARSYETTKEGLEFYADIALNSSTGEVSGYSDRVATFGSWVSVIKVDNLIC